MPQVFGYPPGGPTDLGHDNSAGMRSVASAGAQSSSPGGSGGPTSVPAPAGFSGAPTGSARNGFVSNRENGGGVSIPNRERGSRTGESARAAQLGVPAAIFGGNHLTEAGHRCVEHVGASADNPYAVCAAGMGADFFA